MPTCKFHDPILGFSVKLKNCFYTCYDQVKGGQLYQLNNFSSMLEISCFKLRLNVYFKRCKTLKACMIRKVVNGKRAIFILKSCLTSQRVWDVRWAVIWNSSSLKKTEKSSRTYKVFAILEGKSMYCSAKDISPKKLVFLMTTWQKGDTERTPIKEWMVLITMSLNYALN